MAPQSEGVSLSGCSKVLQPCGDAPSPATAPRAVVGAVRRARGFNSAGFGRGGSEIGAGL